MKVLLEPVPAGLAVTPAAKGNMLAGAAGQGGELWIREQCIDFHVV